MKRVLMMYRGSTTTAYFWTRQLWY